eukprot:gene20398-biopygen5577
MKWRRRRCGKRAADWNEMAPQALREAKGPIDGTHGVHKKWYMGRLLDLAHARKMRISGRLQADSRQGFGGLSFPLSIRCTEGQNPTRSGLKSAPQRQVYPRSLAKDPIDGTHGCAPKTVFSVSTRAEACLQCGSLCEG